MEFVCEQFFMEDYCHEAALLAYLKERLGEFDGFVTFNGKTYDLPLLRARFIMSRIRADLDRPHLDLLHVSRRLFKKRIGGCALSNVERHVLRLKRTHDIEGSLIPQIYFDYLRGLHRQRLVPVFDHNAQDIISMGSLLLLLVECACDPGHPALTEPLDLAAYGRLHGKRGKHAVAVEYLERATTLSREADLANAVLRDLARSYKKLGRLGDAAAIWQQEIRRAGLANGVAFVELAKLLEHNLRDLEAALRLIADAENQAAMARDLAAMTAMPPAGVDELLADMERRKERIQAKQRAAAGRAIRKQPDTYRESGA